MNISGAQREKDNNINYYQNILNEIPDNIPSSYDKTIIPDLSRTFPKEEYYKNEAHLEKIHRILLAYSRRNALIGYCQGFNCIAGRILQIMTIEVI